MQVMMQLIFFGESPSSLLREWRTHFKDLYNHFDFLGLVLTILVIPLRFVKVNSLWSVAGLGYLLNFLRLFKFSCLSRYVHAVCKCRIVSSVTYSELRP